MYYLGWLVPSATVVYLSTTRASAASETDDVDVTVFPATAVDVTAATALTPFPLSSSLHGQCARVCVVSMSMCVLSVKIQYLYMKNCTLVPLPLYRRVTIRAFIQRMKTLLYSTCALLDN
jgi:hypothetical protein